MKIRLHALIFVILSLYYNSSYAENATYIPAILSSQDSICLLSEGWQYSPAGSKKIEFASSWSKLSVPMTGLPGSVPPGGVYWLRCRFVLHKLPDGLSLAVNLGRIDCADETYVNGRLVGKTGVVPARTETRSANDFDSVRIYIVPADVLSPDGTNEIAIRIRDGLALPARSGIYETAPFLGYTAGIWFLYYYRETFELAFFGLMFLIFLYFLIFFMNRPKSREYLYLTVLTGLSALVVFLNTGWASSLGMNAPTVVRLREYLLIAESPVLLLFVEASPETKTILRSWDNARVRLSGIFSLFVGMILVAALFAGNAVENFPLVRRFSAVAVTTSILLSAFILLRAYRNGKRDAGPLVISLVLLSAALSIGWLDEQGLIHTSGYFYYGSVLFFIALLEMTSSGFVRLRKAVIGVNAKLNHIDDMKNRFISNVSKEIAEPLKSIRNKAAELIDARRNNAPVDPDTYLKMQSEINRANSLFERVFLTSKIDMGELVVRLESVRLAPIVRDTVSSLEELAARRNVAVSVSAFDHVKLTADPKNLRTALFEILENAVYYTRPGGSVFVYARTVGNTVEISVSDEGAGIPQKETDLIFQKFYRSKTAETANPNGKGIGLYLAYQLIREMKGNIRVVRRERETGSVFIVTLKRTLRSSEGGGDE